MKIICQKDLLVEAVSNVSRAVCAKSPIPALEGILLKAEEGTLELTGYDLELGIVTTIESKTEQAGELVLSARLLLDIIRRIPGETVSILSDERFLATIRGGASEFTIPGLSAEDTRTAQCTAQSDLVLKQGVLKSMIDQTLFAIGDHRLQAGPYRLFVRHQRLLRHLGFGGRLPFGTAPRADCVRPDHPIHRAGQNAL